MSFSMNIRTGGNSSERSRMSAMGVVQWFTWLARMVDKVTGEFNLYVFFLHKIIFLLQLVTFKKCISIHVLATKEQQNT